MFLHDIVQILSPTKIPSPSSKVDSFKVERFITLDGFVGGAVWYVFSRVRIGSLLGTFSLDLSLGQIFCATN